MSHYGAYPLQRQRSAEDSDAASQGSGPGDAKRLKSLDTQRAFRARKAAHVKDLEVKVALQDIELARLKRENDALRIQLEALLKSTNTKKDSTQGDMEAMPYVRDEQLTYQYQAGQARAQPILPNSMPPTFQQNRHTPSNTLQHQTSYSTSSLPVVSVSMTPVGSARESEPSRSPQAPSTNTLSQTSNSPVVSISNYSLSSTPASTPATLASNANEEPIIIPTNTTAQITKIVCCNGLFPCEDDNDGNDNDDTRWIKSNTGVKGIGSNTVDDFYSLFGDSIVDSATSSSAYDANTIATDASKNRQLEQAATAT